MPACVDNIEIRRQHRSNDILMLVNNSHVMIIEDKTGTKQHSDQLVRYKDAIAAEFPDRTIAAIYFKTGDQGCYEAVKAAGYSCFLRKDLLQILSNGEQRGITNDIFRDFYQYLKRIETEVTDYKRLPVAQWHWHCWKGFFIELQERLGEGKWSYVPNPSGGFMGFWWHWVDNKYLQLENDRLCFKIEIEDKSRQRVAWEEWHHTLASTALTSKFRLTRPRRKNGTWMTVAVLEGDYRQQREGLLDIEATVNLLREVEGFLDTAVLPSAALPEAENAMN